MQTRGPPGDPDPEPSCCEGTVPTAALLCLSFPSYVALFSKYVTFSRKMEPHKAFPKMHRVSYSNAAPMKQNLRDIQVTEESPDLLARGEQHDTVNTK